MEALLATGRDVRVLDVLLHRQDAVADAQRSAGVDFIEGDVRDPAARRRALGGVDEVVHLAAVVGDPAAARDPEQSRAVNVDATRDLVDEAVRAGVRRFVFASTCSNYGRMADSAIPIAEDAVLAPVSLYAEQKVAVERHLLGADGQRSRAVLPALRHGLRRRPAHAIRLDGQRVHTRSMGATGAWRCSGSSSGDLTSTSAMRRAP